MRILVIEDEPKVARTLVKGLEADHFAVDLAGDGEEGLQLATEIDYDGIILDWNLPKLDGLTVLRKLRKSGSNMRILLLSARKDVSDRVCGLQAGADDYLVKPFSFEELLARVHALLRRPQELLDKLSVEDLELDRMRHMVTRGGKPINLTQREYAVLEYLMRNAGRTVTRTMVVEHVWNLGFEGLTNIVDVYINYLRAKIDHGAQVDDVYIHNVGKAFKTQVPDVLHHHGAGNGASGIAHQIFQHSVLALREIDRLAGAGYHVAHAVQFQVFHAEFIQQFLRTAQKSVDPGQQLFERKRFYQVVVGAGLQPANAIGDIFPRAQQQNPHVGPGFTKFAKDR